MVEKTNEEDNDLLKEYINARATKALEDGSVVTLVETLREIEGLTEADVILLFDYDERTVEVDPDQDGEEEDEAA